LHDIQYDLAEGKLNMMFDSINAISNAKNLEDKFQFEINNLVKQNSAIQSEKTDMD